MNGYSITREVPPVDDFLRLRKVAGLSERSRASAEAGLPNSLFAVTVRDAESRVVGMGRIVGDGGCNFEVVDIAVEPACQGQGLGRLIMTEITAYLDNNVPPGAYTCLIADTPWLYEKFGFSYCAPDLHGMHRLRKLKAG